MEVELDFKKKLAREDLFFCPSSSFSSGERPIHGAQPPRDLGSSAKCCFSKNIRRRFSRPPARKCNANANERPGGAGTESL